MCVFNNRPAWLRMLEKHRGRWMSSYQYNADVFMASLKGDAIVEDFNGLLKKYVWNMHER